MTLTPVEHRVPMLSIDNTYDVDELRQYGQRVAKLLPDEKIEWVVELKIDGVAVSLTYENGLLVQGGHARQRPRRRRRHPQHAARSAICPQRLKGKSPPAVLEVRGEIYISNSDLVVLNQQQQAAGLPPFANSRNLRGRRRSACSIRASLPRGGYGCSATASVGSRG